MEKVSAILWAQIMEMIRREKDERLKTDQCERA